MIIDTNHPQYKMKWRALGRNKYNGAYYYSQEIVREIIPRVQTDRNWVTVNIKGIAVDHALVFVHNNKHPENYAWLKTYGYKDLVFVCGTPETAETMKRLGPTIYLPLSVDVEEVKQYRVKEKTKGAAFAGRPAKRAGWEIPDGVDILENLPREELLRRMAEYETIYAVGRCAIEAKVLKCKLKAYDPRYPKVSRWKVLDNKDAAKILQEELDKIDGGREDG